MNSAHVTTVTDQNYETLVGNSSSPFLLDFGATWCPPCRAMDPHVAALAEAYAGRVRVGTCDVDANNGLAVRFGVMSAPTFLVIKKGEVVDRFVGAMPRTRLEGMFRKALGD